MYFQRVPAVVDQQNGSDVAGFLPALEQPPQQLADSSRPPATGMATIAFFLSTSPYYKISGLLRLPEGQGNDPLYRGLQYSNMDTLVCSVQVYLKLNSELLNRRKLW